MELKMFWSVYPRLTYNKKQWSSSELEDSFFSTVWENQLVMQIVLTFWKIEDL